MRRVSRQSCDDGPLLEEQETEGQRQLHNLLLQQLYTDVDIERCVAKKQCFAPAALYLPFGEQAAGVRSLSQFQALQDGEKELASLRELGLTDAEIKLWQSRDAPEAAEKSNGVCAAPGVKQQRLQVIRDKIEARAELLSRPQRFAASRPLSRREMEIERALFQGNDRLGFLTALYHQDCDIIQEDQQGASSSDPMASVYRDVLSKERQHASLQDSKGETTLVSDLSTHRTVSDQSQNSLRESDHSEDTADHQSQLQGEISRSSDVSESSSDTSEQQHAQDRAGHPQLCAPTKIAINQQIGSLCGVVKTGSDKPLTVRGKIETITDEEILKNRESEEVIRSIPRFQNYQTGKPSKNLSAQASVAQLVALFSRFEPDNGPSVLYRLLTGRMKGQAFITLRDAETAQKALQLVHGYRLLGKPLVVEFGRERQKEETQTEIEVQDEKK
ncbi:RNA-binding protein 41 isoform X2 [Mastacembelus armatus]|uniref:RNA-binding protein 41 isoform X2 n=1 Tax=Mastacembelus armatus TaxID=205130 RepID=UPI000E465843|nr:RNA-binding protein 41 isoform X2 [Mastacembelus armatus]